MSGISNDYARVPLAAIRVERDDRQRRAITTVGLIESIRIRGVLNPIIIQRDGLLVAGERRLAASRELGLPDIPVRYNDQLDPIELQIIELEENVKRSDLTWPDLVQALGRIHGLYTSRTPNWSLTQTADSIGMTKGTVSMYLRVNANIDDELVANADTVREAYNMLLRRDQRAAGAELEELLATEDAAMAGPIEVSLESDPASAPIDPTTPGLGPAAISTPRLVHESKVVLCESFLHWAPKYTGPRFNFIHCDFPYGVGVFGGDSQFSDDKSYDDSTAKFVQLTRALCENLDRLMGVSGHLMFWFGQQHRDLTMRLFREHAPSLVFWLHPLVWVKSDNAGIAADVRGGPRHVYETCLFATRGTRNVVRVVSDAYAAPTDKRHHPSAKPEPMLRHFMTMLVDETTRMLDPTCGAGSSIRAAESLGARSLLGLEIDEVFAGTARQLLRQSRALRGGAKGLGL